MSKPKLSAHELRDLIVARASQHPVWPDGMRVWIVPDERLGWIAETGAPEGSHIAYVDCVRHIATIAAEVRQQYALNPEAS